jgi:hypothetical protein
MSAEDEDLDLGNWDDDDAKEVEVKVVKVESSESVDLTAEALRKAKEEEAAKAKEAAAAKPKAASAPLAGGGGGGGGGAVDAVDTSKMTEAQREEFHRRADAASAKEMVGGDLSARDSAAWVPKLIIASRDDLENLGKRMSERVHNVSAPCCWALRLTPGPPCFPFFSRLRSHNPHSLPPPHPPSPPPVTFSFSPLAQMPKRFTWP